MAIIITGVAVSQASGRVGGTIFSRNRGGAYMRNGSIPTTVTSPAAQAIKAATAMMSAMWAGVAAEFQEQWREWATQNPVTNRLGQSRTLSGHQAFVKINARLVYAGLEPIGSPPLGAAPLGMTPGAITFTPGTSTLTVAFTPSPLDAGIHAQVYAYLANSAGVAYVANRLALVKTSAAAATTPVAIWAEVEDRFGTPVAGQTLHIALRTIDSATGLVSAKAYAQKLLA